MGLVYLWYEAQETWDEMNTFETVIDCYSLCQCLVDESKLDGIIVLDYAELFGGFWNFEIDFQL